MELQLEKQALPCLRTVLREVQTQEQTQEIRVSDGMPDIGSVVGAWGQVILRGKEWDKDSIRVNGGTMVWVQYLSEDGEETACMESWLPFQMQWKLPESDRDGRICCQSFLKNVDARITSARKMILRTGVSVLMEGVQPCNCDVFVPEKLPEDVQILHSRYPVQLPVEAGEKAFALDELLTLPSEKPQIGQICGYCLQPEITEEKLMGDKLVFRGRAWIHLHYSCEDGTQHSWNGEMPFSQYCELDGEYTPNDGVRIWPCVTSLEVELQQDQIHVKAGLVCQYRISHHSLVEVVEDAYSNQRNVKCVREQLNLPAILESRSRSVTARLNCDENGIRMADVRFLPQPVEVKNREDTVDLVLSGQFQPLYYDVEGQLHCGDQQWTETITVPKAEKAEIDATIWPVGHAQADMMTGSGQMQVQLELSMETRNAEGIFMVTGLELGEVKEPDPSRPSLILKRSGGQTLWNLAKENGSTMELIQKANDLQDEPEENRMLLIPVV